MEKTINLGGKDVHLTSSAATPLIYKSQFKTDFFADMLKMAKGFDGIKTKKDGSIDQSKIDANTINSIDLSVLYNFIWSLAKNNDTKTPEPIEFFSQFESIELNESMEAIQDLMAASLQTVKK